MPFSFIPLFFFSHPFPPQNAKKCNVYRDDRVSRSFSNTTGKFQIFHTVSAVVAKIYGSQCWSCSFIWHVENEATRNDIIIPPVIFIIVIALITIVIIVVVVVVVLTITTTDRALDQSIRSWFLHGSGLPAIPFGDSVWSTSLSRSVAHQWADRLIETYSSTFIMDVHRLSLWWRLFSFETRYLWGKKKTFPSC